MNAVVTRLLRNLSDRTRETLRATAKTAIQLKIPQDADELWRAIGYRLGLWFARRPLCEEHDAPFDFIASAYFEVWDRIFALAAKGTGKTQGFAVIHQWNSETKPATWTAHVGSVEIQAQRCFDYLDAQLGGERLSGRDVARVHEPIAVKGKPQRRVIKWRNGSRVEILAGTLNQVSGPHPQVGAMDEFELADWAVWDHFSKNLHEGVNKRAQMLLGSTRFKARGPVERILNPTDGPQVFKVLKWCIYDAMARCGYDCQAVPGWGKCPLWSRLERQADGTVTEVPMCHGRAHHASGHLTFDEVVNAFVLSDYESWGTLMELHKPGRQSMFFPEFDDAKPGQHIKEQYEYVRGRHVYLGYDAGYVWPFALTAWQVRDDGLMYQFDELYGTRQLVSQIIADLETKPWLDDVDLGWPDPNARKDIEELRQFFLKRLGKPVMIWATDNSRLDGWKAIRRRLQGPLGIMVGWHPRCSHSIREMAGLTKKEGTEDCEKVDDHSADANRYLIHNLERYLKWEDRWLNADAHRPKGGIERLEEIAAAKLEGQIKDRIAQCLAHGRTVAEIRRLEAAYGALRREFALALGHLLHDETMHGRMERAGLRPPREDAL